VRAGPDGPQARPRVGLRAQTSVKFSILVFPGSNCETDCQWAVDLLGAEASYVWHESEDLGSPDCVILPGGFSYGDYLRCGAIARFSPVMRAVARYAREGGLVLGICNGFQILLEAGLLPGAMLPNRGLKFICEPVYLRVENRFTPFTNLAHVGQVVRIPINHYEGNYFIDAPALRGMESGGQIVLRYCREDGAVLPGSAPNGSLDNIAGVCNESRNVFGLMPHPERAMEAFLGGDDGRLIFESIFSHLNRGFDSAPSTARSRFSGTR